MTIRRWLSTIVLTTALGSPAVSLSQGQPAMPSDEMNAGLAPQVQQKMDLTDAQVKAFFDATDELRAAGKNVDGKSDTENVALAKESLAVIEKHGFKDIAEFQQVGYNAAMAYNVLQQGGKAAVKAKLDKAEAQQKATLERMSAALTPQHLEIMKQQGAKALETARSMQDVPEGNVEIMKKYEDRMKNLGED